MLGNESLRVGEQIKLYNLALKSILPGIRSKHLLIRKLEMMYHMVFIVILMLALAYSNQSHASVTKDLEDQASTGSSIVKSQVPELSLVAPSASMMSLPKDVQLLIFSKFESPADFGNLVQVSRYWRDFINENIKGCTIIIGSYNSGKTCLTHLLVGRQLHAKKHCKRLIALDEITNLSINHSYPERSTRTHMILDHKNKEAIFDCRGFNFAGMDQYPGAEKSGSDIWEAESFKKLLRWKIRLIYVENYKRFKAKSTAFNIVTRLFPNLEQLKQVLRLVIVGADSAAYPDHKLPNVPDFLDAIYTKNRKYHYPKESYKMIKYFMAHPEHTAHFHKPSKKGVFEPREDLVQLLQDRTYVLSPPVCQPKLEGDKQGSDYWLNMFLNDFE